MHPTLAAINFDCSDPSELARFCGSLLGGEVVLETQRYCAAKVGEFYFGCTFAEGYEPPTWPSSERPVQLHLDFAVDDLDQAEVTAVELGAVVESHQPDRARFRVFRDPAGHPFCLRAAS